MKCLSLSDCFVYFDPIGDPSLKEKIDNHVHDCSDCREMLFGYEKLTVYLRRNLASDNSPDSQNCYDEFQMLTFLEGRTSRSFRSKFLKHQAQCPSCFEQLMALDTLIDELRQEGLLPTAGGATWIQSVKSRHETLMAKLSGIIPVRIPKPAVALGATVLVFLVVLISYPPNHILKKPFTTRESHSQNDQSRITLTYPANGDSIDPDQLRFLWKQSLNISNFRFVLLDGEGKILYEVETRETAVRLPDELKLNTAMDYFWQVEGKIDTNGSILSDMVTFRIKSR